MTTKEKLSIALQESIDYMKRNNPNGNLKVILSNELATELLNERFDIKLDCEFEVCKELYFSNYIIKDGGSTEVHFVYRHINIPEKQLNINDFKKPIE